MSVASLISSAEARTTTLLSGATEALTSAVSAVENMGYTAIGFSGIPAVAAPGEYVPPDAPVFSDIDLSLPSEPGAAPLYQDIAAITPGVTPTLSATLPAIDLPTTPAQLAEFISRAPTVNTDITFPTPPSELLNPNILAPDITARAEPNKPTTVVPSFSAVTPINDAVAPTDYVTQYQDAYASASDTTIKMVDGYVDAMLVKNNPEFHNQMSAIEGQLTKYLAGGTGLKASVEDAIYSRAREKNNDEAMRARATAYSDAAARGFTLPSGALASAVAQARQAAADNNAKAANEIVVMQAEMEQKNLQFAVTTSTGLRTAMMNATLSYMQNLGTINGQALDYAKSVLGAVIEVYNTAIKAYSVKLEAYKAEAAAYETRLKGAMAGIQVYQAEVSALQAMTQVDHTKVEVYRARIESLTSLSNVYRAQVEAVQGRANLEKLKLEVFQTQVQTYGAQVQGKNAEWQGYRAAIEGQTAKVQMYGAQVQAFNSQVQAYKADIDAKAEVVRAAATTNDARARQYSATLQGYQTVVEARGKVATTKLENQRQQVLAYQATTQAMVGKAQVQTEYYKAASQVGVENAKLAISASVSSAEMQRNYAHSLAQLHSANATIHANLAGAAMAGMNTLAAETLAAS